MVFGFGKKYKCDTCGMTFRSQMELMDHSRKMHPMPAQASSGTLVQQFKCQTCGMSFNSQSELMEHSRRAHPM